MSNFKINIDKLVSKILNEEIENKAKQISETMVEGEWTEIEVGEELHGGQKKLDVAEPKGKLTSADFKKLRDKKEVDEFYFSAEEEDEEDDSYFDFDGDDEEDEEMEMGRDKFHVTRKPKMMGSFDDEYVGEAETEEGNTFTDKLRKTPKGGKFTLGGKEYTDNSNLDEEKNEKWIQKTDMEKGALHKKLGVPEGENIPVSKLKSLKKELMKKGEGDKKLSAADSKLLKQVNMALTLKNIKETTKSSLKLTENELIDLIEQIVLEQSVKDIAEKSNISSKSPEGLKKTDKVLGLNKKENDDYAKEVIKKMKDYMKDMMSGDGGYDENPDDFPQSNYDMEKEHNEKKYHPSDAVEEYIEAFAYPGMTNLVYDEIKPDDEMIEKQIKGDSKNGNAVTDKDGKALGNVSKRSEKVGERFKKNFDDNLYGAEQMNVSYKRQSQPVDIAGDKKQSGGLKKSSTEKAQKIMNQLESKEDKKSKIISEEMEKMKNLIGYNRKTQ